MLYRAIATGTDGHAPAHASAPCPGRGQQPTDRSVRPSARPRAPQRAHDSGPAGAAAQAAPMRPAVTLMAKPRIEALKAKEMSSCRITTRRIEVRVVDTSAVWHAAAMVKEK